MSTTLLITLLAALLVAGTLVNIVLVRGLAALWRVNGATWLRSAQVVLLILLTNAVGYGLLLALIAMESAWQILSQGLLAPAAMIVLAFINLVIPLWAFCSVFKISLAKSLGMFASLLVASTIVAYGLAFAFRATLAEAFVVPTGAMAPTVLGQHIRVRCPNCGSEVNVRASDAALTMLGGERIERSGYDCLQCGETSIPLNNELLSGDRVLVDKTRRAPRRFDIAVFHVRAAQFEALMPGAQDQKYIKRCVGLPGEEIAIVDGDLFIDGERLQKGPHEAEDLWLAVHDTDLRTRQAPPDGPTWKASELNASGWTQQRGHWKIRSDADLGAELHFAGPLTDRYAYELPLDSDGNRRPIVRDWRIVVDLTEFSGDGALAFFWQHGERATCLAVTPQGAVRVFDDLDHFASVNDAEDEPEKAKEVAPRSLSQVAFAVRDGKAYLSIDGGTLEAPDLAPTGIDEARAAFEADEATPPPAPKFGIAARRCNATLRRIQLHRDVYYRTQQQMDSLDDNANAWQLDREYFFLGDQSPQSLDCRFLGPIHEREIIGIARWCYWPPERVREFPRP